MWLKFLVIFLNFSFWIFASFIFKFKLVENSSTSILLLIWSFIYNSLLSFNIPIISKLKIPLHKANNPFFKRNFCADIFQKHVNPISKEICIDKNDESRSGNFKCVILIFLKKNWSPVKCDHRCDNFFSFKRINHFLLVWFDF